ncbi:Uncharacterized protein ToN1_35830 [Aromatoleum petrolei]|nr:Uncharacterized protein ToN1_35830 [Aromatoleum petrolei]
MRLGYAPCSRAAVRANFVARAAKSPVDTGTCHGSCLSNAG